MKAKDQAVINVDALATKLAKKVSDKLFLKPSLCIFKVPPILSRHNPQAYTPNAFSIGPFHYKKQPPPIMEATQKIKLRYLQDLIFHSQQHWGVDEVEYSRIIGKFAKVVCQVQEAAHACYAGFSTDDVGDVDEFVEVLVLDGCFLIELFRKNAYQNQLVEDDDPVFTMSCMLQYLYHDLILLENQIPWLVLEPLFEMTKSPIETKSLVELVMEFFSNIFSITPPSMELLLSDSKPHGSKHILDLLRNSLVLNSNVGTEKTLSWQPMPSATSLRAAGIKFVKGSSKCILDIQFVKGVLQIPPLFIRETTETVLRNLICLEQCCPNYEPIITSYAILMDNLINTNADMEILCKSQAIYNRLNIENATKFFKNLYDDTFVKENYYLLLTNEVNKYCERRWPKWRTVLFHDYFRHPWALISFFAASFLFALAVLQTVFSIN